MGTCSEKMSTEKAVSDELVVYNAMEKCLIMVRMHNPQVVVEEETVAVSANVGALEVEIGVEYEKQQKKKHDGFVAADWETVPPGAEAQLPREKFPDGRYSKLSIKIQSSSGKGPVGDVALNKDVPLAWTHVAVDESPTADEQAIANLKHAQLRNITARDIAQFKKDDAKKKLDAFQRQAAAAKAEADRKAAAAKAEIKRKEDEQKLPIAKEWFEREHDGPPDSEGQLTEGTVQKKKAQEKAPEEAARDAQPPETAPALPLTDGSPQKGDPAGMGNMAADAKGALHVMNAERFREQKRQELQDKGMPGAAPAASNAAYNLL